jgi:hypothetical protein
MLTRFLDWECPNQKRWEDENLEN